jgi:hypothetical protein
MGKFNSKLKRKRITTMALSMIKRSTVPMLGKGQIGLPKVSVRSNGQISFSTATSKILVGCTFMAVAFDEAKRTLQFQGLAKAPKGVAEEDLFKLGYSEKTKSAFLSGAGLCKVLEYDYKASGNQNFDASLVEDKKLVSFTLPKGKLTPKEIVERPKKANKEAPVGGKDAPVSPTAGDEPEIELEEA